jgi:hypothetical protein
MRVIITEQGRSALNDVLSGSITPMGKKGIKSFYATFKNHKSLLPMNPLMGKSRTFAFRKISQHSFTPISQNDL